MLKKAILVQGFAVSFALQLIRIAWGNGWTIIVKPGSVSDDHLEHLQSSIKSPLYVVTSDDGNIPSVCIGQHCEPLDIWLNNEKNKSNQPYSWQEDECALVLFTSGSTGMPKGVCHSFANIIRSAKLFVEHFKIKKSDHLCCLAPPHTMSGFRSLILPLVVSAKVSMFFDEPSFLAIINKIKQLKPTKILCGPIFVKHLAAYGRRLAEHLHGVEALFCTGSDLDGVDSMTVRDVFGISVFNYYGLTETSGIVLAETINQQNSSYLPPPCKGVQISLTPEENANQIFQLSIISPNIFLGYLGEPLLRRASFDTGDLVQRTSERQLRLLGRFSGAVKAPSTEWIFPNLLECWLKSHSGILNDAVVKGCKVSGGYGIEIWIDYVDHFDSAEMDQFIVEKFGIEYKPNKWHNSTIKRNPLGKISQLLEND